MAWSRTAWIGSRSCMVTWCRSPWSRRRRDSSAGGRCPVLRPIEILCLCIGALFAERATALDARSLALVVNTRDSLSVAIGEYYEERRGITFQNVIRLAFPPGR